MKDSRCILFRPGQNCIRNLCLVVNVDIQGLLPCGICPRTQHCQMNKGYVKTGSICHSDRLFGVANIDPGSAYLNGAGVTANLNLGNEISCVTSKA